MKLSKIFCFGIIACPGHPGDPHTAARIAAVQSTKKSTQQRLTGKICQKLNQEIRRHSTEGSKLVDYIHTASATN